MLNGVPRILLVRLSAIGDVVRVLPALHALRDLHPHGQIDWAVERKAAQIIEDHPALDQCLVFERPSGARAAAAAFRRYCQTIREQRYEIVVDFHGIFKSGVVVRASGAKTRYGFAPPRSQELSYLAYNERVKLVSERMNRIEENLELCKRLGAKRHTLDVSLYVPDDTLDDVDGYIDQVHFGGKFIAVVHAPVDRPEKQWPLPHFAALCDMLLADGRFDVILTWGPGQLPVVREVASLCHRSPEIAPEMPDLKHFAGLVGRADVFFGGDTGPMHIASAMDVPVVGVFGGTDPAKHAPLRQPSEVLYAGPDPPPKKLSLEAAREALEAIDPEQAYDACVRLAGQSRSQTTA